jgi:P-type E1-E2 ATPase
MRLAKVRDLQVDESALTGESVPVEKRQGQLAPEMPLADRTNMAYAGSLVTYGQGSGVIVTTGDAIETGRISQLVAQATDLSAPLTRKIRHFSHLLLYVILALAAVTIGVGLWRGESPLDMFMAAVALAVDAIPEGLPVAIPIAPAIGVSRMARRRVIIRKLPAVETLGSTTVICSDKTGTLTENQMTAQGIYAGETLYTASAVEAILTRCTVMLNAQGKPVPLQREDIEHMVSAMAAKGLRILVLAKHTAGTHKHSLRHADLRTDLIFLGLQGMIDPPRPEAIEAVQACQSAGIAVKMITGDHVLTATAIAQAVGLSPSERTPGLSGLELAALNDRS